MVITDVHSPEKERPTLVQSSAVSETEKLEEDDVHDVLQDDKEALAINSTDNFPEGGFHAWAATVGG